MRCVNAFLGFLVGSAFLLFSDSFVPDAARTERRTVSPCLGRLPPFRWGSMMNRMSFSETIFLFFLALIVFGPKKLPEIARQVGKFMNEFRRASNEFKAQIEQEIAHLEIDKQTILPPSTPVEGTTSRSWNAVEAEEAPLTLRPRWSHRSIRPPRASKKELLTRRLSLLKQCTRRTP